MNFQNSLIDYFLKDLYQYNHQILHQLKLFILSRIINLQLNLIRNQSFCN